MKFSRLIGKAEKIVEKAQQGKRVKSKKLAELQALLVDKIARYEARLEQDQSEQNREKLGTRLKVVKAQLQKSKALAASG
jgi:hypothetical protein